ncbi:MULTISPECIES: DUF262 domain-containing protein [Acinetobacter]|uniref:DUF262 domain-containing protein n=1 Tax=Acinetobacter TaxID=469 RepID=UPI00141ACA4A|nr:MULTISPECIES: DUF262 domain-containing protein [Acinetobacter]MCS4298363.1 uncharacterized protein with ParB-like and HNH nuclease domain [Acinetobacter guillouiae]MCW2251967.1 uncharacterized protein with ParB-like and HNH nuclease domain [Acinetobacter sp. BIGb0204]NII38620.1 uncharacterized protein with ParB-like and HNH nuclease domain [Acinetobacter sp. BIGb0196]
MSNLSNKIEASHQSLYQVLNEKKYSVDYFQREYSWQKTHIQQLVIDLTSAFLNEYTPKDARKDVQNYNSYYLGPFVVSATEDGSLSIIDGQQRLTSLTLFLIFLNHYQKELGENLNIAPMIFSEKFGEKTFNIQVEERLACFNALFETGKFTDSNADESSLNMAARYEDITEVFPNEITTCFANFIDWLKEKVILVQITAYSDENAYTIFETMNDRGLNLTPSEMLKGFLLSKFSDKNKRKKADEYWKSEVQRLKSFDKNEDQKFFQSWFRAQYADSIRQGSAGSKNEDFEKIGTRFHSWLRDNPEKVDLDNSNNASYESFVDVRFKFFLNAYLIILNAQRNLTNGLEHVFYIHRWGIAPTLSIPLMLAPLKLTDNDAIVKQKIDLVARYIETFSVRRSLNFKLFSATSIRYTMYSLVKEIRQQDFDELRSILSEKLAKMEQKIDGVLGFRLHGQNYRFVKFLLARITVFIEQISGMQTNFVQYYEPSKGKPFEVEHIWANKYERHQGAFADKRSFEDYRNRVGGLILLPNGTNQSFRDMFVYEKIPHYLKENLLAQSLNEDTYKNNPNFTNAKNSYKLSFQPYNIEALKNSENKELFSKEYIDQRQKLYLEISEQIWGDFWKVNS